METNKKTHHPLLPILGLCAIAFLITMHANAQLKPTVTRAKYFDKTPPLKEMEFIEPGIRDRSWKDNVIRNEFEFPGGEYENKDTGPDPVWQNTFGRQEHNEPILNFEGTGNVNGVMPPDTDGDVGPNHYIQIINDSFQIYDKEGNSLFGPADNLTLWDGFIGPWTGHNDGDPMVVYDELADRWVASQFALECEGNTWWETVAVSATPDPLGEWYRYAFEYPVFNDYPKLSVWPDAYYCTFNLLGDDRRVGVSAYEREAMLNGDTNARHVFFDLPLEWVTWAILPADFDGPPPANGTPCYMTCITDDSHTWWDEDQIRIWEFSVDWDDPQNSTFGEVQGLNMEPYSYQLCEGTGLEACIPQPDGAPLLDALSGFSMQPLQYRNFGAYETMVFNHTVNADGNGLAGIRWYELRKENEVDGWYIYQQGTYAPDQHHRWMGSIAMDARGYIALGYTVSSTSVYPSLRYTGRPPGAPLGEMTFTEEEIIAGGGSQTGDPHRWGDYSMMAVDPSNDTTFWYTGEYMATTSGWDWSTRIASFNLTIDSISPDAIDDLQAYTATTNAVTLQWSATGNDGNEGKAYFYDIRYNMEPISEENWENSSVAENEIIPADPGESESFTIEGLGYNTEYYFAIKAGDKQFNLSTISNSPSSTIAGPPVVYLEEPEVAVKVFEPGIIDRPYVISNTGETDLNFQLQKELVSIPGNSGNILEQFENGAFFNRGITWADGYLYMLERLNGLLYKYDTTLQMKVDTFDIHNEPYGLCWDGTCLWIGDYTGLVRAYHLDGSFAGLTFSCPFDESPALTYSGEYFVVAEQKKYPQIYFLDQDGKVMKIYKTDLEDRPLQFAWADDHYGSNLWFMDMKKKIGQFIFLGDSALVIQKFDAAGANESGIAHDGTDLWQGENFGTIYRMDDGIDEIPWFSAEPASGTIPSDANAEINIQADLSMIPQSDTSTLLHILSNDPQYNLISAPFSVIYSSLDLGKDTSFCNHLHILLDAGDGYQEYIWSDGSQEQTLLVDSTGYGMGTFSFWVEATDFGGSSAKDSIIITLEDCTGIYELGNVTCLKIVPNPFSNSIRFEFELTDTENIEISLNNILGEPMEIIHHSTFPKGNHHINWETGNLANGLYFIQVRAGHSISTQKVIKQ